jgi:hypothetical protein
VNGRDLVWLDNAATTQRPRQVIDRVTRYYRHENSNVHRGAHELAARSTDAYEEARSKIARFLGAPSADNIVYVRGTTEGVNLVAQGYVRQFLRPGDEIILTMLEHHANIVPWQMVAKETGALLRVAPIDRSGQIILSEYEKLFSGRTRFVTATHVPNALGRARCARLWPSTIPRRKSTASSGPAGTGEALKARRGGRAALRPPCGGCCLPPRNRVPIPHTAEERPRFANASSTAAFPEGGRRV